MPGDDAGKEYAWNMYDELSDRGSPGAADWSEGFGERLLGVLLDRSHSMPPHLIAPLIAQEITTIRGEC